jgi:ubiquinone/menaquinone biosynthesis C-methylase UbiE
MRAHSDLSCDRWGHREEAQVVTSEDKRAHGVTPGLRRDYVERTAERQAAFALPYLSPGMDLLDVGCGPGTITLGLAQAVAPGHVTGIDHDAPHIEGARALAETRGITNVTFEVGDALLLPFEDGTFDAVFENDVFTHLSQRAGQAAAEIRRVLKPGGVFAARDVDVMAVVWGHATHAIRELDRLMVSWQQSRGSDITLGRRLPEILREAGFVDTRKSVSADTKGDPESVRSHAEITVALLDGPFGRAIIDNGGGDAATVGSLKMSIRAWGEHPDAFFANVHVEVIGWEPGGSRSSSEAG